MGLVNLESCDKGKLKEAVKTLNPHLEAAGMDKVKVVGITPQAMADGFTVQIEALADSGKLDPVKEAAPSVVEFYNSLAFIKDGVSEWKGNSAPAASPPPPAPPAAEGTTEAAPAAAPKKEKKPKKEKPPVDPNAPPKKRGNPPKTGLMSRPKGFEEVKKRIENPTTPTAFLEGLLLKGGKKQDIVNAFQEWKKVNAPDFNTHYKTVGSINAHLEYRRSKGYVYEEKEDFVQLVGYNSGAPAATPTETPAA